MTVCYACGAPGPRRICDDCIRQHFQGYTESKSELPEPDVVEQTVMAQRLWRWTPGKGLEGMRQAWKSGFMEAKCQRGHSSPHWTNPDKWGRDYHLMVYSTAVCLCGVNAYKLTHLFDRSDLSWARGLEVGPMFTTQQNDALAVLGIVELGGEVHEYDFGYRAQYARIVEGTVLTSLPLDRTFLAELEEQYDAPFRVRSYDDWKDEWEATYGRDRETEETDSGSETTAGAKPNSITYSGTIGAGQTTSLMNQLASHARMTSFLWRPPTRWERFKDWWHWYWLAVVASVAYFVWLGAVLWEVL